MQKETVFLKIEEPLKVVKWNVAVGKVVEANQLLVELWNPNKQKQVKVLFQMPNILDATLKQVLVEEGKMLEKRLHSSDLF